MVHPEGSPSVVVDAQTGAPTKRRWSYSTWSDHFRIDIGSGDRAPVATVWLRYGGSEELAQRIVNLLEEMAPLEGVHDVKEPGSASCTENPLEAP